MTDKQPLLVMRDISKSFPGVQALKDVTIELYPGEVLALVGENGAGKSTLMKILSGAYSLDEGEIVIDGEVQGRWGPVTSRSKGVAMVYQEFNLVPFRSVWENMFLGREKRRAGIFLDKARMRREAYQQMESIGTPVAPDTPVGKLGVAQQQMVEIAKILSYEANIVVFDEPTSALTVREMEQLFEVIRQLKAQGVGIIYISHRLEEIFEISDRVAVLRDGELIGVNETTDVDTDQIVTMMVGREVKEMFPRHFREAGEVALRIEQLESDMLHDVTLEVRYGEIVGLAGLVGSGRTETARAAFGLDEYERGTIELMGQDAKKMTPTKAVKMGLALLPEDRRRDGLFPILPLKENVVVASLRKLFPTGFVRPKRTYEVSEEFVERLRIQPPHVERQMRYFSGGNQQKTVIAKWLATEPQVIIFDEPTRGIDVGAKAEVHAFMDQLANEGNAILMISSELPEILGMSDRIYVMHEGTVAGEFSRGTEPEKIIRCAMGVE